jgi:hypothetical protein
MELMTYMESQEAWVPFPSLLQGLRMSRVSSSDLLLASTNPVADLGDIVAFAAVFKAAGGESARLAAACPCPSLEWIRAVRAEGLHAIYFAPGRLLSASGRVHRGDCIEVPRDLCPALHVRIFDGQATSVCGNRYDLLVLGRGQFAEHCFARYCTCRWAAPTAGALAASSR